MTAEEMWVLLKKEPFQPLRVYLDDGRLFEIPHPSLTLVSSTTFAIGIPANDLPLRAREVVFVGWPSIQRVETLPTRVPTV